MSQKRRTKLSAGTIRRKLLVATGQLGETASQRLGRWWNRGFRKSSFSAVYGVFLLLPAIVLTPTFFQAIGRATGGEAFWQTDVFGFFAIGATVWTLWFFGSIWTLGEPRPLHVYVYGHELTHAIWVWLWNGKVFEKKMWSADGGYIVTDTHNFLIALAPYFYPIYSLALIILYGVASQFCDVAHVTHTVIFLTPLQWLFLFLGVTWAFHLSFTIWMIPKGQTDLRMHGTFFSLVVIYLMNLLLLSLFLIIASPELSFGSFGRDLLTHTEDFAEIAWHMLRTAWVSLAK